MLCPNRFKHSDHSNRYLVLNPERQNEILAAQIARLNRVHEAPINAPNYQVEKPSFARALVIVTICAAVVCPVVHTRISEEECHHWNDKAVALLDFNADVASYQKTAQQLLLNEFSIQSTEENSVLSLNQEGDCPPLNAQQYFSPPHMENQPCPGRPSLQCYKRNAKAAQTLYDDHVNRMIKHQKQRPSGCHPRISWHR